MIRAAPDDEFLCLLDDRAAATFTLEAPNLRRVVVPLGESPTVAARADSARSPLDMLRLTRAVARLGVDVFFSPTVYSYFPLPPRLPTVITIHDAIAERFPALTLPSRRARLFWNAKVRGALWQARLVLTVSDYAAGELTEVLGVAPGRIRVTSEAPAGVYRIPADPAGIAAAAARAGLPAGARWIVYVGGFNPHKHVDLLVRAHAAAIRDRTNPPHLLLVGTTDGDLFHGSLDTIRDAITASGTAHLVHWAGFVADEELRHLHGGAVASVLASASEGFGLPAVEAAACGTPVVATTASPLPTLLAGGGLFVPPGDLEALTAALVQLLDDEPARAAMGRVARERAMALSWDASARVALDALHEAAA
ncbi:MAG: glycosyltransferase family 4 protein [Gemmatimonadales bacterium]|nr:glycosyltransferase family 4 protein [Gemmatimonadales bacterium]